ncbi:MAG: DUF1566 domain-containing protein [Magnetococcales bacterium]|nr:DUF1566 domain-containing protein [Magnetococcales bacterium]
MTDVRTGLTWSKAVLNSKVTPEEAEAQARNVRLGGHDDWRVPTGQSTSIGVR